MLRRTSLTLRRAGATFTVLLVLRPLVSESHSDFYGGLDQQSQ
jgi:hypothetical protein